MNGLKKDIAAITDGQWAILISLALAVNLVVVIGISAMYQPEQLALMLAQVPMNATRTPFPTFTPTVTGTPFATAPNTRVPTWTPSITPTPEDTATPTQTSVVATRVPIQVSIDLPTATPSPTPIYDYIGTVRQLTPCENNGKHHIFAYVRDVNGNGIPGMRLRVTWPGNDTILTTGTKIEDPGLTDFAMFKGSYHIEVLDGFSQVIGPISPDIGLNETCEENGNTQANSLYHYSFEVIFTKVR